MVADLKRNTVVTLNRRHELDPAVAVLVVVPIDELGDPLEVGDFYWTVPAPDIVNSGQEEQGLVLA